MQKVLITGINGFIARHLARRLLESGIVVVGTVRDEQKNRMLEADPEFKGATIIITGDIGRHTDWTDALDGVDTVFHLAGTVHRPDIVDPNVYNEAITAGTVRLATEAIDRHIKRLVFLSTSAVYGLDASEAPLTERSPLKPVTPYGMAKLEAERALCDLADDDFEVVILRPPLVYGKDAPGNFSSFLKLIRRMPALPFGSADNKRSFVYVENLVELMVKCGEQSVDSPAVFNVADGESISTKELCQNMANALDRNVWLVPIPTALMGTGLKLIGKGQVYAKLFGSFELDTGRIRSTMKWTPVTDTVEAIRRSATEHL